MSKKLRLDQEGAVERIVEIYDSLDNFSGFEPGFGVQREENLTAGIKEANRKNPGKTTSDQWPVIVTKRACRAAAVCLGLLCVLLLAGIIVLVVISIDNQSVCDEETDRLRTKLYNVTEERDNIQTSYKVLSKVLNDMGWIRFGSSYYSISTKTKGWGDSREDCVSRGADLVIINSPEEQVFVDSLRREKRAWIGLTDRVMERDWRWVDGTPLTIQNWRSNQPDNNPSDEDCAESTPNEWNDLGCSQKIYWVCEIAF